MVFGMVRPTRRDVLRVATFGTTAAVAGLAVPTVLKSARADDDREQPTFVFVSGSNAPAYSPPELGLLGYRTLAVDLPGHRPSDAQFPLSYQCPQNLPAFAKAPSPMAGVKLDDYVATVVGAIRVVADYGPVILVGSSLGGATISRVGNAIPGLISRIVYDSAFCCVDLPSIAAYFTTPEASTSLIANLASGSVGDPAQIGASRINWRSADPTFLADARAVFIADASEAEFLNLMNNLQPDETVDVPLADSQVHAATWGRIPRTYIRHSLDRLIPIALQDRMIREADALTPRNRFDVRTVETSHVPTFAKWREIVKILAGLARSTSRRHDDS